MQTISWTILHRQFESKRWATKWTPTRPTSLHLSRLWNWRQSLGKLYWFLSMIEKTVAAGTLACLNSGSRASCFDSIYLHPFVRARTFGVQHTTVQSFKNVFIKAKLKNLTGSAKFVFNEDEFFNFKKKHSTLCVKTRLTSKISDSTNL